MALVYRNVPSLYIEQYLDRFERFGGDASLRLGAMHGRTVFMRLTIVMFVDTEA
jgi:hypothetical protein